MGTNTVTSEGTTESEQTTGDRQREQATAETGTEVQTETTQREAQVREVQQTYQRAVERFSRDLARHSRTSTERSETQLGGEATAGLELAAQVSGEVSVADLIPGGRLASRVLRFLSRALPQLDAQINAQVNGSLTGRFQQTWGSETTEEEASEFESSLREAITSGYTALWRSELERQVRVQVTTSARVGGEREREGTTGGRRRTEAHRTVRSTVPVAADRPELVLRGAPARSTGGGGGGGGGD
jgi:hypothetical protein